MGQRLISLRLEIPAQVDLDFKAWAEEAGRSKRRHGAVLLRKLTALRVTHTADLQRLGLIERAAPVMEDSND